MRVQCLMRAHHKSCRVAVLCPRCTRRTATDHVVRGNTHAPGSRRTRAAGDCRRRLFGRRLGTRSQGTSAKAPSAPASRSDRGRTSARARRSRARRKLTFHNICDLSRRADQGMRFVVRLRTSRARVRVICQVCTHCSIRHLADTKRDPSLACAVGSITTRDYVVRTTCTPRNCVAQGVGIC
jgi:hypothetical protein